MSTIAQDTTLNKMVLVDSAQLIIKADTNKQLIKKKRFKAPEFYYFGLDLIAPSQLLNTNNNYKQLSFFSEAILKKNVWLTAIIAADNAKFENKKLKYTSNTASITLNISQTFFPDLFKYDFDNAFAGLGYGLAYSRTSEAQYTIQDTWGTQTGVVDPNSGLAHWIEFMVGFRFHIVPKVQLGWRIQGKALLNPSTFEKNIAPIHIANYGSGDKASAFGYQLMLAYRWRK